MAKNRFVKTYSNYVLKSLHQSTSIGNIYERDWMTISDLNSYAPGSLPSYGLNGFKMVVDDSVNLKKRHHYGSWLKNGSSEFWTNDDLGEGSEDIPTYGLTIKPNSTSILDYACFGSATKMIESSIMGIIDFFPAELYLTEEKVVINGQTYYFVDNPFGIEMDNHMVNSDRENLLRVFSKSYDDYWFIDEKGNTSGITWEYMNLVADVCTKEGDELSIVELTLSSGEDTSKLLLYYMFFNGKKTLFHNGVYINCHIRPKNKQIKKFFNSLDAFQKVILNRKTNYTAIIETPSETDKGSVVFKKPYTWPQSSYGDWNLDVSSTVYANYVNSLLSIGEFYDRYYTDNIWRAMTHEAIINFDWTLKKQNAEGDITEFDDPNPKRVQAFLQVAGRQFDDLKQYIDGIANANAVTYNQNANNPDDLLNDMLSNYGWDVKTVLGYDINRYISRPLYPSHVDGYTAQDANFEFFRRLLLNSNAILSAKGTKRSVEMVASLFGYSSKEFLEKAYHETERDGKLKMLTWGQLTEDEKNRKLAYSYDMSEYVYVVEPKEALKDLDAVKQINKDKLTYDYDNSDEYQGLPLAEVIVGEEQAYLIPWFRRDKTYDADIYFESKGGWGLSRSKEVHLNDYPVTAITSEGEFQIFDESVKNLKFVNTILDLTNVVGELPKVNDIYYVYDISNKNAYNWGSGVEERMSHYFILKDSGYYNVLGVVEDESEETNYGWKNISENELENASSEDAKRVYYLESVIETNGGNNPHFGHNAYDNGYTYKKFYENIFSGAEEEDSFMYYSNQDLSVYGFNFENAQQKDNVKTWYFTDVHALNNIGETDTRLVELIEKGDYEYEVYTGITSVGIGNYVRETEIEPINYEQDFVDAENGLIKEHLLDDEAAANSIINSKSFCIEFMPNLSSPGSMYDFITNGIMHYVKQVIPSTTILHYNVPLNDIDINCYHKTYLNTVKI